MEWAKLNAEFMEEIGDAMKYASMADSASGHERQVLLDMAHDEHTHAKHICHMLKDHGLPIEGHKEQLQKAMDAIEEIRHHFH